MYASRRSAVGPHVVVIALIGLSTAACSDSARFSEFSSNTNTPRADVTGSVPPTANRIESQPMPYLANGGGGGGGGEGTSGGGRGMGSYQPGNGDVTGSVPAPRPTFTWEGGTPIVVGPGETLQSLSRRYGVPVAAIMEANNMTSPAPLHVGRRLVIPHRRGSASAIASVPPSAAPHASAMQPPGPAHTVLARGSSVHVVVPGETLHSIARLYRKSVMVLAKANNIAPDTMVRVGERIVIPGTTAVAELAPAPPPVAAPPPLRQFRRIDRCR